MLWKTPDLIFPFLFHPMFHRHSFFLVLACIIRVYT